MASSTAMVPNAQDAVQGRCYLSAVVHKETGRQITNMDPQLLSEPLIEIRCAGEGFGWHDRRGNEWRQNENGTWYQHTRVVIL